MAFPSSRRHRLAAETAAQRGYVLERRAEANCLGHALYGLRHGHHLPTFVGSIGEVEDWLKQPPMGKRTP